MFPILLDLIECFTTQKIVQIVLSINTYDWLYWINIMVQIVTLTASVKFILVICNSSPDF